MNNSSLVIQKINTRRKKQTFFELDLEVPIMYFFFVLYYQIFIAKKPLYEFG